MGRGAAGHGIVRVASGGLAVLCMLALAACGSQQPAHTDSSTAAASPKPARGAGTVEIYSSLPLSGPERVASLQIEQGIRLALDRARHRAGRFTIRYRALSDASARTHGWNPTATVSNAVAAARNPQTVAYIGELDSGATALSLPILNQAGIVAITPGSGYPGLTDKVAGVTAPGEPGVFYPHGRPTLLRLIPDYVVEAATAVDWLRHDTGCSHLAAASFGGVRAASLVTAIAKTAALYGLAFQPTAPPGNRVKNYLDYAVALRDHGVNCFVLAGHVTRAAVAFTNMLNAQLPVGSVILGTSGFCTPAWSDQARGGVSTKVADALYCTTPLRPVSEYLGGTSFARIYQSERGRPPGAYAYYGYLAARLVLAAIGAASPRADVRGQVLSNLIDNYASNELGTYGFDGTDGRISSTTYGLDRVANGVPIPDRRITPSLLLVES